VGGYFQRGCPHRTSKTLLWLFAGLLISWLVPAFGDSNPYALIPQQFNDGTTYGDSIYFAPNQTRIYTAPSEDAPLLEEIDWTQASQRSLVKIGPAGVKSNLPSTTPFFCFIPRLNMALMAVVNDNEAGWAEVVVNQQTHQTGWVHPAANPDEADAFHLNTVATWLDFMKVSARAHGIVWLSGVSQYQRSVRVADDDDAKMIDVLIVRDLKVRHIRGNWLLVEVLDFERNTPIGWIRWRDEEGRLLLFPNLLAQKSAVLGVVH